MSSPRVKFTHMGLTGNIAISAEISRFIMCCGGIDFEDDIAPPKSEKWEKLKPGTPYRSLPVLDYEGCGVLAQSMTVARFLAKKAGLAGRSDLEQAQADMIVDSVNDVQAFTSKIRFANAVDKAALAKSFVDTVLPGFLSLNEAILTERGGKHFAGDAFTYGDLYFWLLMDTLSDPSEATFKDLLDEESTCKLRGGVLKGHPNLHDLVRRVGAMDKVAHFKRSRRFAPQVDYVY